jgi:hypothetical protein
MKTHSLFFGFLVGLVALILATPVVAQTGTLFVEGDNVGIREDNPQFPLHITRADGQGSGFRVSTENAPASFNWFFQQNAVTGAFLITPFEGGGAPLQVFPGALNVIPSTLVLRDGKVGIGTQSPVGKLDVNGAIFQRGGVLHPDYVFEADYELESIEEHAKYMWEKKHLPAVGKGVYDEDGTPILELGARSQGMLEELEKAHIYIEMLNTMLKDLRETVAAQQALLEDLAAQKESGK